MKNNDYSLKLIKPNVKYHIEPPSLDFGHLNDTFLEPLLPEYIKINKRQAHEKRNKDTIVQLRYYLPCFSYSWSRLCGMLDMLLLLL